MRGVWITPINGGWAGSGKSLATQKAEALAILNNMQKFGFNTAFVHMRTHGDRLYTKNTATINGTLCGDYGPTSRFVTTNATRGGTISTYSENGVTKDIFDYWIEEGHKRGIEVYAWLNPFRTVASDATDGTYGSWTISQGNYYFYDPGLEKPRVRIVNVCRVLTNNYDLDGIIFDDYFYYESGMPEDSSAPDYSTYINSKTTMSIADWRRNNINTIIAECQAAVHAVKPYAVFAVGPAGGAWGGMRSSDGIPNMCNYTDTKHNISTGNVPDNNYDNRYADPIAWMRDKTVDFLSPQLYWDNTHKSNAYSAMSAWYAMAAKHFGVPVIPSQNTYKQIAFADDNASYAESTTHIKHNRENNEDGMFGEVCYASNYVVGPTNTACGQYFKNNVFQYPSAVPAFRGKYGTNPGKITGITKSGTTLSWTAMSGMRYLAYAVPTSVTRSEATDPEHGGLRAEYILSHVLYTNSVSISGKTSGYWYAVAPLDRYGNEWDMTTYGDVPPEEYAEVSLTSPATGTTAAWSQKFTYTGTSGATFKFELSKTSSFSNIVKTQSSTATSTTVDFSTLSPATTYYWRVTVSKSGYITKTSEVRTIVSPTPSTMQAVTLVSPADGAETEYGTQFTWSDPMSADSYTFQVSSNSSFTSTAISAVTTSPSCTPDMYSLTRGATYYWRVISHKARYYDATSAVRSFIAPDLPKLPMPHLYFPRGGEQVTSDFAFICEDVHAETCVLEVATDPDFKNIHFSGSDRWYDVDNCKQYTVPLNMFPDGTYYWRVRVTKDGYYDATSLSTTFIVGDGQSVSDYVPYRDPVLYPNQKEMTFTNLWLRDASHNAISYAETNSRDMAARGDLNGDQDGTDIVYIADKGTVRLHRMDGRTGRDLDDLSLSFDGSFVNDMAPNGVLVDDNNNLLVHNLATSANLTIAKIDVKTGYATTVFSQSIDNNGTKFRVDHIALFGSVDNSSYTVFSIGSFNYPSARTTYVQRWIVNGNNVTREIMRLADYGPAPRIAAVSQNNFIIDGYNTAPLFFKFVNNSSTAQSPTDNAANYMALATKCNGIATFRHDGTPYIVMANGAANSSTDLWEIATCDNYTSGFSGLSSMWSFPTVGIGSVNRGSFDYAMPISVVQRNAQGALTRAATGQPTSTIYCYASGNGLAAYTLTHRVITGVEDIDGETLTIGLDGKTITFGVIVDKYGVYDAAGRLVASGDGVDSVSTMLRPGMYLVRATAGKAVATKTVAIR